MFDKPKVGWVKIMIDEFQVTGSYLTDIPCDALRACIYSIENNAPFTLYIDEEGITDFIVSYYNSTYIIRENDEIENYSCDKDFKEASQYVPLENLYLSTQCGFASTEEGNVIKEEDQWKKIALIKEIVEDIDRDFSEWIVEFTYLDKNEQKYKEWIKQLEELLNSAKEVINNI